MTLTLSPTTDTAAPTRAGEFAESMSALAGGVVLVTSRLGDRPWGTTVTAFASVSADPPTVLVSLATRTAAARAVAETRRFGVSILAADQHPLARYASVPGAAKFLEPFVDAAESRSPTPAVDGALAHLDCEVTERLQVADHTVFVARVRAAQRWTDAPPLVYHRRDYRTLADETALALTGRS